MKTIGTILGVIALLLVAGAIGYYVVQRQPVETSEPVVLDEPDSGASITSPLTVRGRAKGTWFFEASFPVVLTDAAGVVIAQVPAQAQSDWMTPEFVPFEATLAFSSQPSGSRGFVVLKKDNPSGLPENDDSRTIPVVFK